MNVELLHQTYNGLLSLKNLYLSIFVTCKVAFGRPVRARGPLRSENRRETFGNIGSIVTWIELSVTLQDTPTKTKTDIGSLERARL